MPCARRSRRAWQVCADDLIMLHTCSATDSLLEIVSSSHQGFSVTELEEHQAEVVAVLVVVFACCRRRWSLHIWIESEIVRVGPCFHVIKFSRPRVHIVWRDDSMCHPRTYTVGLHYRLWLLSSQMHWPNFSMLILVIYSQAEELGFKNIHNDCWRQKTRVLEPSRGVVCVILCLAVLIQYRRVADVCLSVIHTPVLYHKSSSEDEIANVNVLRRHRSYM